MSDAVIASNDRRLTAEHVGSLVDAQGIVNFFAYLLYDTDRATPLDHASLGLDSVDLRQQIRAIRRIGEDPSDGDIVIYLFEARSVTVALTQSIARRFRERPESALLVLTKDYETLDFVLVERELAAGKKLGSGLRQIIRPRTLSVNRRNPDPVSLRVLQRFTFTESDSIFQWEKLRSAFTLAEWTEQYFNNRALFSDYYLLERLTDPKLTPQWEEDVRPMGREVLRQLAGARATYSGKPEQAVRNGLYEPLFRSLGFEFDVNKPGDSDLDEPDYVLYAVGDRSKPLAQVMTYVWNRNLDDADDTRDHETPDEIPGALVVNVLAKAATNWVVVTNGKLWRLYSATAANKATNYYEIDLEEAANAPDQITALKYWWLFFRRQAFAGFLDDLLQQSADYAKALGERLKDRTFTTIFPHFARGFIEHQRTGSPTAASNDLDLVFRATMTFLYRLMFILYAESLNLLPATEERGYGEFSLARLKRELAQAGGTIEDEAPKKLARRYGTDSTELYQRLQLLFNGIDAGDAALNLPMYNGGLFSDATPEGRFLAGHAIPDRFLALGLDRLCRDVDDKTQALALIDYKSLGVRQLGSIYEGLLEFKLRIAAEPLVVVREKGKEVYLPAKEAGGKRAVAALEKGDVYLENDKRERKATGSYYTPDYIVKYIVEHTVGPVLERKAEALAPRLRAAQKLYVERKKNALAKGEDPEKFWNNPDMQRLADDCLDVKVLDPAMGSGHFLVEAVDFVSDRLIQFLNAWTANPVWALLERTRADILADMDRQKVSIDPERLTRVSLLKRSVLKRCIYGVDLNAMAVELAKVSLWLDAFTLGAPLSFLDHHLKHGNSLIGARITEVRQALEVRHEEQLGLFSQSQFTGVMLATDLMRQVSYLSDNTVGQLAESQAAYRAAGDHLAPFKRILDVWTSRWFGNGPSKSGFEPALEFLRRPDAEAWLRDPATVRFPARDYMDAQGVADTALRAAAEKRFFHWELEFPEVFFAPSAPGGQDVQLREDGGFDAVVGNPPYIRQEELGSMLKPFLQDRYRQVFDGIADISVYFIGLCQFAVRASGRLGYITSGMFRRLDYGVQMRRYLGQQTSVQRVIDFGEQQVFGDATTYPVVIIIENSPANDSHHALMISATDSKGHIPGDTSGFGGTIPRDGGPWIFVPASLSHIFDGWEHSVPLSDLLNGPVYRGITTGLNEAFVIDSRTRQEILDKDPTSSPLIKRYVGGEQIQRWHQASDDLHIILIPSGFTKQVIGSEVGETVAWKRIKSFYPGVCAYLEPLANKARVRYDQGDYWWELRPCNYYKVFEQARLFSTKVSQAPTFSFEDEPVFSGNTTYVLPLHTMQQGMFLLAILNSQVCGLYSKNVFAPKANGYYEVQPGALERFPVPHPISATNSDRRTHLAAKGRSLYGRCLVEGHACVLEFVAHHLALDESDVVHDLLAFLAEQMIELNKQKQAEVKRFLGWLEGRLRVTPKNGQTGIDSLTGKTIIQGYLGDYQKGERETAWDDFYYRLHQNRGRFAASLEQVRGEIEAEYEQSLAVLLPVKRQLATTDALIDQIVYKLYGLSEEEIAIVEGPAYQQALSDAKAGALGDKAIQTDEARAEAIAGKVLPAAERLRTQVALSAERSRLDQDLPGWRLFPDEVVTFLLTAEYNIASQPDFLDFSTSVISYAKAVEAMLYHRLFVRFRGESGAGDADCKNKFLQEFMRGERHLTLGSMSIALASSKEPALRAYTVQLYPRAAETFFGAAGVVARVNDQAAVDLRNAAAHDETLTRDDARAARAWALGILQYL